MNRDVDQLLRAALALPGDDLGVFVSALVAAVEERGLRPADARWREEIGRRSDDYEAGNVRPIPWAEVKERARRRAVERHTQARPGSIARGSTRATE